MATCSKLGELCGGQRPAEEAALSFRTVPGPKEGELFRRFDALGNHPLLEVLAHINYGGDNGRIIRVARNLLDKGLVNLQDIDGKLLEISEAGIAGAEVIHRKVYAQPFEILQYGRRGFGIVHKDAFGELEVETARFQAGVSESGANPCEKIIGAEFGGRNIDGNPLERQTPILPFASLPAGFV
jgi:hypothetical protein